MYMNNHLIFNSGMHKKITSSSLSKKFQEIWTSWMRLFNITVIICHVYFETLNF